VQGRADDPAQRRRRHSRVRESPAEHPKYQPLTERLQFRPRRRTVAPHFPVKGAYGGFVVKEVILTPEGHEKLKEEIERLSTVKRREVAERIKQAREFGDIAENSEYDDAKNEQAMLEHRIATLEERLKSARVIQKRDVTTDVVSVGTIVRLRDVGAKETIEYAIVGSAEANPAENKLSNESPVGRAIIGRKKGETVEVAAPRGSLKYKIMDIKAA
jgi:transcription elongation factor GreA